MKRLTKRTVRIALLLCSVGLLILLVSLIAVDFNVKKLGTVTYETNAYEINDDFSNITIKSKTADIRLIPWEEEGCKIVCYEEEKEKHTAAVQENTLMIDVMDTRRWYDHIGISFEDSELTIYLPEGQYGELEIKSDTGEVEVPEDFCFETATVKNDTGEIVWDAPVANMLMVKSDTGNVEVNAVSLGSLGISTTTGTVKVNKGDLAELDVRTTTGAVIVNSVKGPGIVIVETDTGEVRVEDVFCRDMSIKSNTGEILLKNTDATEHCSVISDTGDVNFEEFDAITSLTVKTKTGDVSGTLLSEKKFLTVTETGTVSVPKTTGGGTCEIATSTGDIEIEVVGH